VSSLIIKKKKLSGEQKNLTKKMKTVLEKTEGWHVGSDGTSDGDSAVPISK
jgi:hypothetical protein